MPNPAYDVLQLTAMLSVRQGNDGYSPSITVKEDTDTSYVLTIENENGSFDTPNLISEQLVEKVNNKVDKVEGKELSTNDFTDEYRDKLESLQNYDDSNVKSSINLLKTQVGNLHNYDDSAVVASVEAVSNRVDGLDSSLTQANSSITDINERISKLGAVTVVDKLPEQDIRSDIIYAVKHENYVGYIYAYGTVIPELTYDNLEQHVSTLSEILMSHGLSENELNGLFGLITYGYTPIRINSEEVCINNYYDNENRLYTLDVNKVYYKIFNTVNELSNYLLGGDYLNDMISHNESEGVSEAIDLLNRLGFKYSNNPLSDDEIGAVYLPETTYDYYIYNGKEFISLTDDVVIKNLDTSKGSTKQMLESMTFTTEEFDRLYKGSDLLIQGSAVSDSSSQSFLCLYKSKSRTTVVIQGQEFRTISFNVCQTTPFGTEEYYSLIINYSVTNQEITVSANLVTMPYFGDITIETGMWHTDSASFGYTYAATIPGAHIGSGWNSAPMVMLAPHMYDDSAVTAIVSGNICPYALVTDGSIYVYAKEIPTTAIRLKYICIE